jgi:predicted HD phosphohydrolase
MLHSAEFGIHVKPAAGSIAVFDNKRILHGRSEVKESEAARWLQGCYVNRDGLWATYEREQRFFAETAPQWKALNETTKSDLELMGREYSEAVDNKMVEIAKNLIRKQHNGNLLGQPLSLFDHGLQTASRALRANASDEVVVVSLLHDAFETMVTKNHGEMAAAFLAPWISPQSQWILSHHEIFQIFYYGGQLGMNRTSRDMFIDSPHFNATVAWCEQFDAPAFDPDYPMLPLSVFDGPLERVFSRQQYWWDPNHPKAGAVTMTKQAATADQ